MSSDGARIGVFMAESLVELDMATDKFEVWTSDALLAVDACEFGGIESFDSKIFGWSLLSTRN